MIPLTRSSLRTELDLFTRRRILAIVSSAGVVCLTLGFSALLVANAYEAKRSLLLRSDMIAATVSSLLSSIQSPQSRQKVFSTYLRSLGDPQRDVLSSVMVIDDQQSIVMASRTAWIGTPLTDQSLVYFGSNPTFLAVRECFRRGGGPLGTCFEDRSPNFQPFETSNTVARAIHLTSAVPGAPDSHHLVLVQFNPAVLTLSRLPTLFEVAGISFLGLFVFLAVLAACLHRGLLPALKRFVEVDSLTDLVSRTAFMDLAMKILLEGHRMGNPFILAVIDIDHFKHINDGFGHLCGDRVLAELAATMRSSVRSDDLVARLGGEEFGLLLPCSEPYGEILLERVRQSVAEHAFVWEGKSLPVTISIGAVSTQDRGYNLDYLYSSADKALYQAKNAGRNAVRWATAGRATPTWRNGGGPAGEVWALGHPASLSQASTPTEPSAPA